MGNALDAIVEIFSWVGLGLGAAVAVVALIAFLADGTWMPVRGVVERLGDRTVVRWFDADGGVNEAELSEAQLHEIGAKDMIDIYAREGRANRMRLHRRSPLVRGLVLLAGVFLAVGIAALAVSLVMLFVRG
jgi:hypothetical protein